MVWICTISTIGSHKRKKMATAAYRKPPFDDVSNTGLILGLHPTNERRRYKVTLSLTGWAQI